MNDLSQKGLIVSTSLNHYFYDELMKINNTSTSPLPQEIIFYVSDILNRYAFSEKFFDVKDGKVTEKILGVKLLESYELPHEEKLKTFKDVGDYTLIMCGYFFDSFERNRKILSKSYYQELGERAYRQLNDFVPECLNIAQFYRRLAGSFEMTTEIMTRLSYELRSGDFANHYLLDRLDQKKAS